MQGSIVTFLEEIKWFKAILLRSHWRSNVVRLFCKVPARDQMLQGSFETFLIGIK